MVDTLFIFLERNALTLLLYLSIYSLSWMDICIMMCRLNKITPRNKMRKRKYRNPMMSRTKKKKAQNKKSCPATPRTMTYLSLEVTSPT
jgi:hypothetical protein